MKSDSEPKIGAGHASAFFRQGLRELRGAIYPESNVAQQPEYGLYGTLTPGEIADARQDRDLNANEEPQQSTLDRALEKTATREDQSMDRDAMEMDR